MIPLASAVAWPQGYTLSNFSISPTETPGWVWESFADRVMGGKSDLQPPAVMATEGGKALLLAGTVVTKGGGFIQVRLKREKGLFDASAFTGVELEVDARTTSSWYVFLRTKDNLFPWSYYAASIQPTAEKSVIRVPFTAFKGEATARKDVRPEFLSSVAIVAAFKDFAAYMRIYRVGFY
jgi:hypothetical protein